MKKKKSVIILVSLIVIGVLFALYIFNFFGLFKGDGTSLSTTPIDCADGTLCKFTVPPYQCPLDVDFCQVRGEISCESTTSVQRVIFRTNAIEGNYDGNVWVAYDYGGSLKSFTYTGTFGSSGSCRGTYFTPLKNYCIDVGGTVTNPTLRIWTLANGGVSYELGGNADLTPTPIEPYTSNNQELFIGENPYSCGSTFQVLKTDSNIKNSEVLKYSSNVPGVKQTSIFRLEKGETAEFLGGTYSDSKISYNSYRIEQTCTQDYCEGNGVRKCEAGKPGSFVPCVYGCSNGACTEPYEIKIEIKDSKGFIRNSFGKNEDFKVYLTISSPQQISGNMQIDIREGSVQGNSYISETKSFTSNTPIILNYNFPLTGEYYIILTIDYPGLIEPEIYGTDPSELNTINIVDDFTANLRISQTLGGVQNMNKFFTGYPVKVEYIFKEPGDTPVLPDSATVTYQVGSAEKITLHDPTIQQDDFAGYYIYEFTPTDSGSYKFEGTAVRGSFTTTPSIKGPYPIESDEVVIEYTLSYNPVVNGKQYVDILSFTTKNRDKNFIETDNTVDVRINGVESGTIPIKGSNGKYSIDYNFPKENADYVFVISSNSPSAGLIKGSLTTELIKSGTVEEEFCKSDSECGIFGACNSGNCETNISLIITLAIGFAILIVIIMLVITFIKNKKKNPNIGGYEDL